MNLHFVAYSTNQAFDAVKRLLLVSIVLSACHEDDAPQAYCVDTPTQYALDEVIPEVGQTAGSYLGLSEARQGKITWTGDSPVITVNPKKGEADISISVEANPSGFARFVRSEKEGRIDPNDRLSCLSRVELDTLLRIQTSDGALIDTWQVIAKNYIIQAGNTFHIKSIIRDIPTQGNFSIHISDAESAKWEHKNLWLIVHWRPSRTFGDILFEARSELDDEPGEPGIQAGIHFTHIVASFEASAP